MHLEYFNELLKSCGYDYVYNNKLEFSISNSSFKAGVFFKKEEMKFSKGTTVFNNENGEKVTRYKKYDRDIIYSIIIMQIDISNAIAIKDEFLFNLDRGIDDKFGNYGRIEIDEIIHNSSIDFNMKRGYLIEINIRVNSPMYKDYKKIKIYPVLDQIYTKQGSVNE